MEWDLEAGIYSVEAAPWGADATGDFTLTLSAETGAVNPPRSGKQLTVSNIVFNPDYPSGSKDHVVTGVMTNTGSEAIDLFRHDVRFYRADGTLLREQELHYWGDDINPGDRLELAIEVYRGQQEQLGWDYFTLHLIEAGTGGRGTIPCVGCDDHYPPPPSEPCGIPFDEGLIVTRQCSSGNWWGAGPGQTLILCWPTEEEVLDSVMRDGYTPTRIGTADWINRDGTLRRSARLWRTEYALWATTTISGTV